jgi:hypothetical protein
VELVHGGLTVAQLRGLVEELASGRLWPQGLSGVATKGRGDPVSPHQQQQTVTGQMRWPSDEEQRRRCFELVDEALQARRSETNAWVS